VTSDEAAILEGDVLLGWAELDRRCDAVAAGLDRRGVPHGGVVALTADASINAIIGVLGTVRAGRVAAPIPARLTAAERAVVLSVLRPVADLGAGRARATSDARGRVLGVPGVVVLTSGTTAEPKGVILSSAALQASADAWLAVLPPATGWLLALGLGHVAGLGVVWRAVAQRVPVRIDGRADPAGLMAASIAGARGAPGVSHVSLVPAQLVRLLDHVGDAPPPSSLRAVLLGGGAIDPALVTRVLAAGWPVIPTYGLSEAGSGVTALPSDEACLAPSSAGRALPGVEVSIDEPGADGVGEIVVRTPAAFSGYLDAPPHDPGAPIRTGDLGRLDEAGRLYVVDRRTDRIVRGGENLSPSEIEAVLVAHPAIADAAVVGRPDPVFGQVPVAVVALRPGVAHPGAAALAAHCRATLAGFKVPVSFVRIASLPRTSGGKLRRQAVRELLDRPRPGSLVRPDGTTIGWRSTGTGPPPLVLLHGTLSTAAQLDRLAAELAGRGAFTVHAVDRRGSGTSPVAAPAPIDVSVHVADLVAVLDHLGLDSATLVGLSYGGAIALELAARHPRRVSAIVAWEPPYGPLADAATRRRFADLAAATERAHRTAGAPAAGETFLRAVAGDAAWDRLPARSRAWLGGQGDGALADAALLGLDAAGLAGINAPTTLLTGGASEPFYAPIARALETRIPGARCLELDGLGHAAPITDSAPVAAAIRDSLETRR
jgi:o-succinylbenzoate---CoA ligase